MKIIAIILKPIRITFSLILKNFTNIYTKKDTNLEDSKNSSFFLNEINTLEHNNDNAQSSHLSEYECGIALKEMKNNKVLEAMF